MFQIPSSWSDLKEIVENGTLERIEDSYKRSEATTQRYQEERQLVSREVALKQLDVEIKRYLTQIAPGTEVSLTKNKYPYDFLLGQLPNVSHYLLWFKGPLTIEEGLRYLRSQNLICCLYENPIALKSIPEINHYQVFINKAERAAYHPVTRQPIDHSKIFQI